MSPQKDIMTSRQEQEQPTEDEDNLWILENPMRTSKIESPSVLTATSTDTWQKSVDQRRKNVKLEHVSNAIKKDI